MLAAEIVACRRCPRLVAFREKVALEKRAAYRNEVYWGKPVPGFGDRAARIVIVGLAPGAHGANRTGRVFTGDRSGDFLYAALHRAGLASQPFARSRDDGLELTDVYITCPVKCVPPENRPRPDEIARCSPFFDRELALLQSKKVLLALGAIAHRACFDALARAPSDPAEAPRSEITAAMDPQAPAVEVDADPMGEGWGTAVQSARGGTSVPAFAHGAIARVGALLVLDSYHVSQQNTQTGRLTAAMFDEILAKAKKLAKIAELARSPRCR